MLDAYTQMNDAYTWIIVSIVIAIAGGIVTYFLFVCDKTRITKKFPKFRDFLSGDMILLEHLVRIVYLVLTIYAILSSFALISFSFWNFIYQLIVTPIEIRLIYELVLMFIRIWHNTDDIKNNTKK